MIMVYMVNDNTGLIATLIFYGSAGCRDVCFKIKPEVLFRLQMVFFPHTSNGVIQCKLR
jgi:hypothetical protein